MTEVLIRYTYPGTTNGRAVGDVYVTHPFPEIDPRIFSHTYDPAEANRWPDEESAIAELRRRFWPGARLVPVDQAKPL